MTNWWRVTEERGIELCLDLQGMMRQDVEIVEFPYEDDWYSDPRMLDPLERPSDLWLKRDIKSDMAFRPVEARLERGEVDAIYTLAGLQEAQVWSGKFKLIEDLTRYPDWTLQVANTPVSLTVDKEFTETHPELVVAYMRGIIKVGRWINENKRAAATFLHKVYFHPTLEETAKAIDHIDFVPKLSPQNLAAVDIQKDFMLSHGYLKNDFKVSDWIAPEFAEAALKELGG